jgi:restriction endonuclease S subunit
MKQNKLIRKVYKACIENNLERLQELKQKEFAKIFKRREEGKKTFGSKWAVIKL